MARARAVLIGIAASAGLSAVGLSGCAAMQVLAPERAPVAQAMPGELEPIKAAAVVNDLTVFWVTSNGCTKKDDLLPVVSTRGAASTVTLRRLTEDRCTRPLEDGIELRWSFDELGLKPGANVTVNNPYQLPPSGT